MAAHISAKSQCILSIEEMEQTDKTHYLMYKSPNV